MATVRVVVLVAVKDARVKPPTRAELGNLREEIERDLAYSSMTVLQIANKWGVSDDYLRAWFLSATGVSVSDYRHNFQPDDLIYLESLKANLLVFKDKFEPTLRRELTIVLKRLTDGTRLTFMERARLTGVVEGALWQAGILNTDRVIDDRSPPHAVFFKDD